MKKAIPLFIIATALLLSCQHQPVIPTNPTITITEPLINGIYNNNDTIKMDITMSDEDKLVDGYLYLRCDTDTFFAYQPNVLDLSSFSLDTFWILTGMSTGIDAFVTINASNNNNGITSMDIPIFLVP